jgi:hypothetical protein
MSLRTGEIGCRNRLPFVVAPLLWCHSCGSIRVAVPPDAPVHEGFTIKWQLVAQMRRLMAELGVGSDLELAEKYGIDRDLIDKLKYDYWKSLNRDQLLLLMSLAQDKNFQFLKLEPQPLLATFSGDAPAIAVVGKGPRGGSVPEDTKVFHRLSSGIDAILKYSDDPLFEGDGLAKVMATQNLLVIGGPLFNPIFGRVASILWESVGIDVSSKPPVQFIITEVVPPRPCLVSLPLEQPGVVVRVPMDEISHGKRKVQSVALKGHRSGVVIACVSPCAGPQQASKAVTTLMIAGCSKAATIDIANDFMRSAIHVRHDRLTPGTPAVLLRHGTRRRVWFDPVFEQRVNTKSRRRNGTRTDDD